MTSSREYISSFDIFDTCLIRKCGTPENFFDVLSLYAFKEPVEENIRQEFVVARYNAEVSVQKETNQYSLSDIWEHFIWNNPALRTKEQLKELELSLEEALICPVFEMVAVVEKSRRKGHRIVFISDMYLSSSFLTSLLIKHGFYKAGDAIYISCECGASKSNGSLYKYVQEKEKVPFTRWKHYGDNIHSDYNVAQSLGIKSSLVKIEYTPYQNDWYNNDVRLNFHYASILAGIGRALRNASSRNSHTDLVIDIIAPFYCSLVWRMMEEAYRSGIKRLYFCARDTYMMYHIAERYVEHFEGMSIHFLYISKQSLYYGNDVAKEQYFKQIGLATRNDKVAIVDVRSTGKTMLFLNDWLEKHGYNPVRGYYYELFIRRDSTEYPVRDYYCEVNAMYMEHYPQVKYLLKWWKLQEQYFPLNTLERTIDYTLDVKGQATPVFDVNEEQTADDEKWYVQDIEKWSDIHKKIILDFADNYIQLELYKYSNEIFNHVVIRTLNEFFTNPRPEYLHALSELYVNTFKDNRIMRLPYVARFPLWKMLKKGYITKHVVWDNASKIYSMPNRFISKLYTIKQQMTKKHIDVFCI